MILQIAVKTALVNYAAIGKSRRLKIGSQRSTAAESARPVGPGQLFHTALSSRATLAISTLLLVW